MKKLAFSPDYLRWIEVDIEHDLGDGTAIISYVDPYTKESHREIVRLSGLTLVDECWAVGDGLRRFDMELRAISHECDCCGMDSGETVIYEVSCHTGDWVRSKDALTRIAKLEKSLIDNGIELPK